MRTSSSTLVTEQSRHTLVALDDEDLKPLWEGEVK